jgi:hypothetical protein
MPPRKTRTSIDMIPLSAHPLGGAVLGKHVIYTDES